MYSAMREVCRANFSLYKENLLRLNGWDEDLVGYGFEDRDLGHRIQLKGMNSISVKNKAILYHLHHGRAYNHPNNEDNNEKFKLRKSLNRRRCEIGIGNYYSKPRTQIGNGLEVNWFAMKGTNFPVSELINRCRRLPYFAKGRVAEFIPDSLLTTPVFAKLSNEALG